MANKNAEDKPLSPLEKAAQGEEESVGLLANMREWLDALIIAFVLAMFIRTFVVELFKIPSGSMSPTLLGDLIAEGTAYDSNQQSNYYLLIAERTPGRDEVQVFRKENPDHYFYEGKKGLFQLTESQRSLFRARAHVEEHRILVNKFAFWFKKPERGDIVVFRVPFYFPPRPYSRNGATLPTYPYNRNTSVYVKRAAAFEDERLEIRRDQHLYVNGQQVTHPKIYLTNQYFIEPEYIPVYDVKVPKGQVIMLGDNSDNSQDSRYWGGVPYENLRGKAFMRYWPWKKIRFLS